MQAAALGHQATVEMELKRREAVYKDIMNRQQAVSTQLWSFSRDQLLKLWLDLVLKC